MIYNFKKETKLYLVRAGLRYTLDTYSDLTFSQTFNETPRKVKTLHEPYNMFDEVVIVKANPANFTFTMPLLTQGDLNIVKDLMLDYETTGATLKTFDLYVQSNTETYKIEKAVIENAIFQITRDSVVVINISGSAAKLQKFTDAIPGILIARSSSMTHIIPTAMQVMVDSVEQPHISAIGLELQNSVRWLEAATIHNGINVTSASETVFPEAFVVEGRVFSGSVQQYITPDTNADTNTWKTNVPISIKIGAVSPNWLMQFVLPRAVYTNRVNPDEIYMHNYDFRLLGSPSDLKTVIQI